MFYFVPVSAPILGNVQFCCSPFIYISSFALKLKLKKRSSLWCRAKGGIGKISRHTTSSFGYDFKFIRNFNVVVCKSTFDFSVHAVMKGWLHYRRVPPIMQIVKLIIVINYKVSVVYFVIEQWSFRNTINPFIKLHFTEEFLLSQNY